ncbi:proteasome 26S subunit [Dimargaris cristalligena]|uniref:26S proteasome regulatory subunit RPN1 n=1 Tax=Dimargaris cristalligena TaxID=215637 RepID=A0A4P9ZQ39_9FUNG|nr:proteasome 26S subunit [Dimargaris cristalligena]|eukprot:RKP34831.1 proteasome 26S subunit [Dimargaris cristalligena]
MAPGPKDNGADGKADAAKNSPSDAKPTAERQSKNQKDKDKNKNEEELSEEDQQLVNELEMLLERLAEPDTSLHMPALEALRTIIRTSTSSMTSVPKPLKYLRPHYHTMVDLYNRWPEGPNWIALADILSVLGMTYSDENTRDCLKYRLLSSTDEEDLALWGHEYVRHLCSEISYENSRRVENDQSVDDLRELGFKLVPFCLKHNAEHDAVDLLIELESISAIPDYVDINNYARVGLYMLSCVNLLTPPDDMDFLRAARQIYRQFGTPAQALPLAIRIGDSDLIQEDFDSCTSEAERKQLAFIMARQQLSLPQETANEEVLKCLRNSTLSTHFIELARELDVYDAKTPEDIYKSQYENTRTSASVDSARQNLASSFVNAFVNAGFGHDKLMAIPAKEESSSASASGAQANTWIYKNKDAGMMSATASLGSIYLWNIDGGLSAIDQHLYSNDDYIKAGALLGIGLVNVGISSEMDPARALLVDFLENTSSVVRVAASCGLGLAYAGSGRDDIVDMLNPAVANNDTISMEQASMSALSAGMVAVGTCHVELTSTILEALTERTETDLNSPFARFMGLGLALLYLGKQDAADATLAVLKAIEHPVGAQVGVLVHACAYAGTGNVLKVQEMLHLCSDHLDPAKDNDQHQGFAVLGVALIAMGEEVGAEMALRAFNHLMHYGEPVIRRAVPLAIGLLCVSNPLVNVLETLSKYSHDSDLDVAVNAIFAMGLVGAGTNNARLAQMLRQLASYYYRDANSLFMVRVAQGMIHMGKGTLTLNPYYHDRTMLSPTALIGLLVPLLAFTSSRSLIFGNSHYLLYYLVRAMYPRFLITMDENLQPLNVTVRVGQAVDVVGQAGKPKTITGFQTHSTPVLLAHSERAELATEEYIPLSKVLEGFVILKKNPDYMEEE